MPDGSSVPIDYVPEHSPVEFSPQEIQEAFEAQLPHIRGGHIATQLTELLVWARDTNLDEKTVDPKARPLIPFMRAYADAFSDLSDQLGTPEGDERHTLVNQATARQFHAIAQTPPDSIARKNMDALFSMFQVLAENEDSKMTKIARDGLKMLNAARAQIGTEQYLQNHDFTIIVPTGEKEIIAWDHKMGTDFVAIRERPSKKTGFTHYEAVLVDSKGLRYEPATSVLLDHASVEDYGVDRDKMERYAKRQEVIVRNALRAYGVNPNNVDPDVVHISHKVVTMPTDRQFLSPEGLPNPAMPKIIQALEDVFAVK